MGQACPWPLWLPKSVIACICVFNRNSQRRWNWSKKSKENIQKQIKAKLELWIEFWKSMQNKRVVQNLVLLLSSWQNVIVCYAFASWVLLVTDLTSSYKQCFPGRWIFLQMFFIPQLFVDWGAKTSHLCRQAAPPTETIFVEVVGPFGTSDSIFMIIGHDDTWRLWWEIIEKIMKSNYWTWWHLKIIMRKTKM